MASVVKSIGSLNCLTKHSYRKVSNCNRTRKLLQLSNKSRWVKCLILKKLNLDEVANFKKIRHNHQILKSRVSVSKCKSRSRTFRWSLVLEVLTRFRSRSLGLHYIYGSFLAFVTGNCYKKECWKRDKSSIVYRKKCRILKYCIMQMALILVMYGVKTVTKFLNIKKFSGSLVVIWGNKVSYVSNMEARQFRNRKYENN